MVDINEELTRDELWEKIVNECENFLYSDNGLVTASLYNPELTQFSFDFEKIKEIIRELKYFIKKFGKLDNDEEKCLLKYRQKFLDLNTGTNGIKDIYKKICSLY